MEAGGAELAAPLKRMVYIKWTEDADRRNDEEDKGYVNNLRESSNPVPDQGNPWESWAQVFTIGALALVG